MKRNCEKILSSKDGKRAIYIDSLNKAMILEYLNKDQRHKKKFLFISEILLGGLRSSQNYSKEEINDRCKGVTAMKFFKGQENDRIYCKEINSATGTHIIVASILYKRKKTTKLSHKEISEIERVGGYIYEVQ